MANAGYPDLHAHIAELDRQGLLIRVQRPINKDTEMHPLVRWQFRGGIPEAERKAFLFENVVDSKGRKYDIPVAVGILASNRQIYSVGIGCAVENIQQKWGHAEAHPMPPVLVDNPPCQEIVMQGAELTQGNGVDALPIPISTPGFDNAPYASCSMFITKDPGYRAAEHRQLSRHGEKPDADGHESGDRAQPGHPRAFSQIQGARREDADSTDARRAAGDHVYVGAQAAEASRRACGRRRAGRRADQGLQGQDCRSDRAGGSRNRRRRLSRYRMAGAGGQFRRVARLHESEGVQRLLRRHRHHPPQGCRAGLDHQPGDAERK